MSSARSESSRAARASSWSRRSSSKCTFVRGPSVSGVRSRTAPIVPRSAVRSPGSSRSRRTATRIAAGVRASPLRRISFSRRTSVEGLRYTRVRQVRSVRASSRSTGWRNRPAAVRKRCSATRTIALRSVWNSWASWWRRVLVSGSRSRGRSAQGMRRASAEARLAWFRASGTRSGSARSRRAATRTSAPNRRGPMPAANSSRRCLVVGSNRSGIGSPTGTRPMLVSLITFHLDGNAASSALRSGNTAAPRQSV
ncbi:hypothetical protein E143388_07742 [Rhodococcus opacus]|nr:hypothetical protein E143388_07742 [Rhodococcus opacus]